MNKQLRTLFLPAFILIIQVLLLSHVHMVGMAVPFIFLFIILMMPYQTSPYLLMLVGFSLGLTVDLFMNTIGQNAAASTFLAFVRPSVIRLISKKDYAEISSSPNAYINGFAWYASYVLLCCLLHSIFLYTIEVFSFANYTQTIIRILTGTLLSTTLIVIIEYLTQKRK